MDMGPRAEVVAVHRLDTTVNFVDVQVGQIGDEEVSHLTSTAETARGRGSCLRGSGP
jgi:hypothetical protein